MDAIDEFRQALERRDVEAVRAAVTARPDLATTAFARWPGHRRVTALGYLTMLRCDTVHDVWRDVPGTGPVARVLLEHGAPLEGDPDDRETPLITAASYGDAEVARVLVAAGADVDARSAPDSGGVPGETALMHAAVFGKTDIVDLLVGADPDHRDPAEHLTALDWCRRRNRAEEPRQEAVAALLAPVTTGGDNS